MDARRLVARRCARRTGRADARGSTRVRQRRRLALPRCMSRDAPEPFATSPSHGCAARLTQGDARSARGSGLRRCLRVRVYGQGQSVHPPRFRAVAGTATISWRRWSDRSVMFSVPAASWTSVASCADVTGRGWRAAITSSTACWRAVRWLTESRGREVPDGPPEQRRRLGEPCDPRSPAMHRPLVVRRGSPVTPAARPPTDSA